MAKQGLRDLRVWQRGKSLAVEVYRLTESFPRSEEFGLKGQMRRATVSIPSNLAEGWGRMGSREFFQFVRYARGSVFELQSQFEIARELGLVDAEKADRLVSELSGLAVALFALVTSDRCRKVREAIPGYGSADADLLGSLADEDKLLEGVSS